MIPEHLELESLRAQLRDTVTPGRFRHCEAVEERAVYLAGLYGADLRRARAAGLLHDICHDMAEEELLNYLQRCGILLDILTLENPPTWHAIAGAQYIRRELGVDDEEIIGAIRYHTTGRAGMSVLEKVVYIADLTSADRKFLDIGHVRRLSEQSLDAAVRYSICYTVEKLIRRKNPLIKDAWEAYNHFVTLPEEGELKAKVMVKESKE